MCGIAGFVDFDGLRSDETRARLKRMTDAIAHRGPDGEGVYVDRYAALGHRRLAIIDLATGQQPMGTADGRLHIVFNGEIYNFLEVRAQLAAFGHSFRTHSDTEVILASYRQWGERCVEQLRGMFAFAIWDKAAKTLFLARDRVGKKPLYYYRNGRVVAFASELKALRAGSLCPDEIDPESLDCYFSFGYVPAPRTIYKNVQKVRAARTLLVSPQLDTERQYWRLSFARPAVQPFDQVVEQFEDLLDSAVKDRLMSEVPLGAFLSGGVDSSLVVSSMARLISRPVVTNSIGFHDANCNELGLAREVAGHLEAEHHELVVTPHATDVVDKIARHFDEPIADSSAVPTWYVCQMARRTVTVALSGDGGDETFGGYSFRYIPHVFESRLRAMLPPMFRQGIFGGLARVWPASSRLPRPLRIRTIFENLAVADSEAFYRDLSWLREDTRGRLYTPDFLKALRGFTPFETVRPHYLQNDAIDALGRAQYTDINFYMTDDVLTKVDRMSMAHSLEVRCPLLDHRILEFAAGLPSATKMNAREGKLPLRALAERRVPPRIARAPKHGFSIPAARWLRGELRHMVESAIFRRNAATFGVLDEQVVRSMWREHLNGSRDHSVFIWGLLMLGLWDESRATPALAA